MHQQSTNARTEARCQIVDKVMRRGRVIRDAKNSSITQQCMEGTPCAQREYVLEYRHIIQVRNLNNTKQTMQP